MQRYRPTPRTDLQWRPASLASDALAGQQAAVVGGTNGIGRALARSLAARGVGVTVVGRTFRDDGRARLQFLPADLASMRQAQQVAQALPAEILDLLILTTGIFAGRQRQESPDGIELDLAVSYLSRFVIVRTLADRLGQGRPPGRPKPRVFIMGFPGTNPEGNPDDLNSEQAYQPMVAHAQTVLGNEALVLDSAGRYPHANFYGLNPGLIKSNIRAGMMGEGSLGHRLSEWLIGIIFPSAEQYSEKTLPLLYSPDLEDHSGAMFDKDGRPIQASRSLAQGPDRDRVIAASEALARRALARAQPDRPDAAG